MVRLEGIKLLKWVPCLSYGPLWRWSGETSSIRTSVSKVFTQIYYLSHNSNFIFTLSTLLDRQQVMNMKLWKQIALFININISGGDPAQLGVWTVVGVRLEVEVWFLEVIIVRPSIGYWSWATPGWEKLPSSHSSFTTNSVQITR